MTNELNERLVRIIGTRLKYPNSGVLRSWTFVWRPGITLANALEYVPTSTEFPFLRTLIVFDIQAFNSTNSYSSRDIKILPGAPSGTNVTNVTGTNVVLNHPVDAIILSWLSTDATPTTPVPTFTGCSLLCGIVDFKLSASQIPAVIGGDSGTQPTN